jgi:hypothetical protein
MNGSRHLLLPVLLLGVTVTLHMPVSGRKISDRRALIDTGSEATWIYPLLSITHLEPGE